ncbi:uncharacterized WD repeat-containing protein C3H5.08c-like isoform X2 [Phalaenopsis equestris]|uniref:uncharacterized WD repeat-containing protein C3H5.08c-like isoform X2 n=2 Tax=Phalaenopsis equestris TaxID=78828 RepID=UPI0009E4E260|nr:uncharacterized WD repeat-containing protein C3H5.08c-like isoform X2 [Phalaenopsis equestris]
MPSILTRSQLVMMAQGCFSEEEDVDQFFDSREELSSLFDSCHEENSNNLFNRDPLYEVWIRSPSSIQHRRTMFMKWMGLGQVARARPDSVDVDNEIMVDESVTVDLDRLSMDCGVVLRGSESENGSLAFPCFDEVRSTSEDSSSDVHFAYGIKKIHDGRVFSAGEVGQKGTVGNLLEFGSNQMATLDKFERRLGPSTLSSNCEKTARRRRIGWLRRLRSFACIADKQSYDADSNISDYDQGWDNRFRRVRVRSYRKQTKELSAVFMGQNFVAHHGAILTMKFSPDGEYLASGGEDGVVRVWKVMECQSSNANDIPFDEPSCIYFSMNDNSDLSPIHISKKKSINSKSMRRTTDLACVVIPRETFQISEKPLYEFHGHNGEVLDLAWSKGLDLLSSSVDETVRLWKLGCDGCLKVFPHNNYVTTIQFDPSDDRYFISGSIDGKARIWEISTCRVVDWTDARQIITAVCYRPDGKVVVVGSMMGDCRFYNASDNHLQLDAEVTFQGRTKSKEKRITGLQFCPNNHLRLMVTSADSTVRIIDGFDVVSKFKGLRNARSQISAMFTPDGQHIVSASEDSNVCVWNHSNQDHIPSSKHVRSSWSSERFTSDYVLVAVPWQGFSSKNLQLCNNAEPVSALECSIDITERNFTFFANSLGNSFNLWPQFLSEITPKGSATWPEEQLPSSMPNSSNHSKSQLKFLKTCWQSSSSHSWGRVIVTAGCDGRIRSFQNFGLPVRM